MATGLTGCCRSSRLLFVRDRYFLNPVNTVAASFDELLRGEFRGVFRRAIFAVPKRFGTANFDAFATRFPEIDRTKLTADPTIDADLEPSTAAAAGGVLAAAGPVVSLADLDNELDDACPSGESDLSPWAWRLAGLVAALSVVQIVAKHFGWLR